MKTLFPFLLILAMASSSFAQVDILDQFEGHTHYYNSTKIPYRLFVPKISTIDGKVGLVLALHGVEGNGTDNLAQINDANKATYWTQPMVQSEYPCFVLVPQCPGSWGTKWVYENVIDLIDSLINCCSIDSDRLYITGISAGGNATWMMLDKYSGKFAAAAPVCGAYDRNVVEKIKNIPIWNFHGQNDQTIPTVNSQSMVIAYDQLGYPFVYPLCQYSSCNNFSEEQYQSIVKGPYDYLYSEIYGVAHEAWNTAYTHPFLYKWMLSKAKRTKGTITLSGFDSYGQISGDSTINWIAGNPNDSVEIWLSRDLENSWISLGKKVASEGNFVFNSKLVEDCAFGTIKLVTKDSKGFSNGATRSVPQAINNVGNSAPFLKISPESELRMSTIQKDSIMVKMIVGDAENDPLTLHVYYSTDDGKTFVEADSVTLKTSTEYQTYWLVLKTLLRSKSARIKMELSDGSLSTSFESVKLYNRNGFPVFSPIGKESTNSFLDQNYPNPFNTSTTIGWQLARSSRATLKVFDLVGREVAIPVDEQRPAGKYETEFNAAPLPKGVYFYQLKAGDFMQARKMVLVK